MTGQIRSIPAEQIKRVCVLTCLIISVLLLNAGLSGNAYAASKIAVLVNNVPITTNDISRRAAFFKLRRMKGNHRTLAKEELVREAMQMREAKRLRQVVSDKEVDAAYIRFAQRNKMPVKVLGQIMSKAGVTVRGFKQYIRAQMSWQRAVQLRAQAAGRSTKPKNPLEHLHGARTKGPSQTTEYTIQQIVFVVPRAQLKAKSGARMIEANNFRSRFPGCEGSIGFASSIKNVSVLKRGRVQAHELPARWTKEIEATPPGKTTRPLKTEKGVELLAICKKRQVRSKQDVNAEVDAFSQAPSNDKEFAELEKKYMAELRKVAVIKNR